MTTPTPTTNRTPEHWIAHMTQLVDCGFPLPPWVSEAIADIVTLAAERDALTLKVAELEATLFLTLDALNEERAARATLTAERDELRATLVDIESRAGDMSFPAAGRCGDIGRLARAALPTARGEG